MEISKINVCEDALIGGGIVISLAQIETVLGIIILCAQVVLILIKLGIKIYDLIKKKKYGEINDAIDDAQKQIESIKEKKDGKH